MSVFILYTFLSYIYFLYKNILQLSLILTIIIIIVVM